MLDIKYIKENPEEIIDLLARKGKDARETIERILELDEDTFSDLRGEAETLAGLMLELKRDFPRKGDSFTAHQLRFTVTAMENHRIDKIKVEVL